MFHLTTPVLLTLLQTTDIGSVLPTYEAVVRPHALSVVAGAALHDVVGVIGLCNLIVGVDHHLRGGGRTWCQETGGTDYNT